MKNGSFMARDLSLHGASFILCDTCVSNIPILLLSLFRWPRGVGKRLDFFRACIVCWQEKDGV